MIDPTMFRADHRCGCSPYLCSECNPIRSRFAIISDYAAAHDLSARQVRELTEQLPGGLPTNVVAFKQKEK